MAATTCAGPPFPTLHEHRHSHLAQLLGISPPHAWLHLLLPRAHTAPSVAPAAAAHCPDPSKTVSVTVRLASPDVISKVLPLVLSCCKEHH
eukprot:365661-Chlamydomonas_euryale.AAC.61